MGIVTMLIALAVSVAGARGPNATTAQKQLKIAYLSFAVANSYDAPMLAAAKDAAKKGNASITVFDANNDPKKQFSQLQTLASSKQYDGIIVQPVFGGGLISGVKQAIKNGTRVVNLDQVLGSNFTTSNPQVPGLSGNVMFVPKNIGIKLGNLTLQACRAKHSNPCKVGYLYSVKASALDAALRQGFDQAVRGHPVKIVAQGESFYQPSKALAAVQTMVQAQPSMNVLVAADQGLEGAASAVNPKKILMVGYGASVVGLKAVASGRWFGDVAQVPASEGRIATQCMIQALRTRRGCGGIDPVSKLPFGGVVTRANAGRFRGEWPG
jgi:ribose transport system substrate-binding protein